MALKTRCKYCGQVVAAHKTFRHGLHYFCGQTCYLLYKNETVEMPEPEEQEFDYKRFLPKKVEVDIGESRVYKKKKTREKDDHYLEFIRSQPCCVCGIEGSHPHHTDVGGMGTKGSDYSCIPLCADHHTLGSNAIHRIGEFNFELHFEINLDEIKIKYLTKYIRLLKCGTK